MRESHENVFNIQGLDLKKLFTPTHCDEEIVNLSNRCSIASFTELNETLTHEMLKTRRPESLGKWKIESWNDAEEMKTH